MTGEAANGPSRRFAHSSSPVPALTPLRPTLVSTYSVPAWQTGGGVRVGRLVLRPTTAGGLPSEPGRTAPNPRAVVRAVFRSTPPGGSAVAWGTHFTSASFLSL